MNLINSLLTNRLTATPYFLINRPLIFSRFIRLFVLCLLVSFVFTNSINAATVSSTSTGGIWSSPSTWVGNAVPLIGDNVIIVNGSTVALNANVVKSAGTVVVNQGGTLVCNAALTIPSTGAVDMTVNGTVDITVANGLTRANTNSDITVNGTGAIILSTTAASVSVRVWTFNTGSTVNLSANGNQTLDSDFIGAGIDRLILSGSGVKTLGENTTISQLLSLEGTATFALGGSTLTYSAGSTLQYKGTNSRTVTTNEFPNNFSRNLVIDQSTGNTITLNANKTAISNINVVSGVLNLVTFTANRAGAGGALIVTGTLMLGGTTGGQTGSNFPTNFSTVTLTGGTVDYDNLTGGQTVYAAVAYNNLSLTNTSGTQAVSGALTVNGELTTIAGGTLNMGANQLLGSLSTLTNNGAIRTQNTSATPIPSGKTWSGTVNFDATNGAQTVVNGTYNNLTLSNTSGTQTANGVLTVNGALISTAGGTLNMGANQLLGSLTTVTNNGTIRTQNTSSTPIPAGKTWAGTVNYDATTGAQTVAGGTYNNLTLSNTSGTQTASGVLTVNGALVSTAGGTLNMGTNQLLGSLTTLTNNGTIRTQNTSATPIPSGKTWSGTIVFDGGSIQFIPAATFNNLEINNTANANLVGAVNVSGIFTLTNGILTTTLTNLLSVTNTSTTAIVGGTASSFVNGPLRWSLPGGLASGSTYIFPVGNTTFLPFKLVNPTTSGTTTARVQAFSGDAGGTIDATLDSRSAAEYWMLTTAANFSNGSVSAARQTPVSPFDVIAGNATSVAGVYTNLGGTGATNEVSNSNLIGTNRFFVLAKAKPIINVSQTTLINFSYPFGTGPSSEKTFTVSGSYLTSNIVIAPPVDYEISTSTGINFQSTSISLPIVNGSVALTTIYVRLKAGLATNNYNSELITISSSLVNDKTVSCSGSVGLAPSISVIKTPVWPSPNNFIHNYSSSTPPTAQRFNVSGSNLVVNGGDVTITPPSDFEISLDGTTYQSTPIVLTASGSLASTTIYVRMKIGLGIGVHDQNVVASSAGAISQNVNCVGLVNPAPTILNDVAILSGFVYSTGAGPSGFQTFNVSGTNLTAPIVLTPQPNYEISFSSGAGYVSSTSGTPFLSISPSSGTVNPTTIYVRLKSALGVGNYNLVNIVITSNGAITKSVTCSGSVVNTATITVSKTSLTAFGYMFGTGPSSEQSFSVSAAGLSTNNLTVTATTNFEISTATGAAFTPLSSIVFTPSGGAVSPKTIYVRLKSSLNPATYGIAPAALENIVASAPGGAASKSVACSGKVFSSPLISASVVSSPSCPGSSITLNSSGPDIESLYWTGPNGFYSTATNPVLATNNSTQAMTGDYIVSGNIRVGGNLITNGDFENGNSSFSSGYGYVAPVAGALNPEGLYTVTLLASNVHNDFTNHPGHKKGTTGNVTDAASMQMVVNGSPTAGVVVWSQSVPVIPGATYQFTYSEQTVNITQVPKNASRLQLYVNGVASGPVYTAPLVNYQWATFVYNAAAGSNTILNLELINQNTGATGNDFSLDDIEFQQILNAKDTIAVVVNDALPASLVITPSATTVTQGATVSYTATDVNGGTTPIYQWKVNGVNVGTNSPAFSYQPNNNDIVTCTMISSLSCSGTATSNTVTMTVNPNVNYWRGTNSTDWGTASNWTANYIPGPGEDVIYASTTNSWGSDAIRDLVLDQDRTIGSLINKTAKRLVIPAAKGLVVNNTITVLPPITDPITYPVDQIYIYSSSNESTPNGSLIFHNASDAPVLATVEMYSKAWWDKSAAQGYRFNWQYFGVPVKSILAEPTFDGAYVRKWYETGTSISNHWIAITNTTAITPFYGYELVQQQPKTYYIKGELINSDFNVSQLAVTPSALYPGQHVFANPYTAAIDIKQLSFGTQTEASVYLYNTGTYGAWLSGGEVSPGNNPGQYTVSPKQFAGNLGIPRQIPSMQAMLVKAMTNSTQASFGIVYNSVVMNNTDRQRAPKETNNELSEFTSTVIDLKSANSGDKMWIFTVPTSSRNFDNGLDGFKILGSSLSPQLYAVEPDGNYQVNAVPDMNDTRLDFQAGSDIEYTMTFTHNNVKKFYPGIYLVDAAENRIIDITESGTKYTFVAESSPKAMSRFKLVTRHYEKDATDQTSNIKIFSANRTIFIHNLGQHNGTAIIYDIAGRFVKRIPFAANAVTAVVADMNSGAYVAKCLTETEELSKRIIVR